MCLSYERTQSIDRQWRVLPVKHGVTIGTDRAEIIDGVDEILTLPVGDRYDVVDMDEPITDRTVGVSHVNLTNRAGISPVLDTAIPSNRVSLVCVHPYLPHASFREPCWSSWRYFFRELNHTCESGFLQRCDKLWS